MKIRKAHILARHFFNVKDNSAGIVFTEYDEWIHEEIQPSSLSGCRNLMDVAAQGCAVMTNCFQQS
jgi:hypothetical protein